MGDAAQGVSAVVWGPWQPLSCSPPFSPAGLRETLDGGQTFRFHRDAAGVYSGVSGRHVARVRLADGGVEVAFPEGRADSLPALRRLMGLDVDAAAAADTLPWRGDAALRTAMDTLPGLRVVHQPLGEALLGFLCSSTKRIVQIKEMMALLADRFGDELLPGIRALPTWEALAHVPEAELRACKLGYRARFVHDTARAIAAQPGFLERVEALPYAEAHTTLTALPGVGDKVADCVLLYGTASLEPFPVDTWILQVMARLYGLEGWRNDHIATFGRAHFGPAAGLAQQFLFAWAREHL